MQTDNLLQQVNEIVRGKSSQTKKVLMAILAGGHILLEDIPGVGKTTLALTFSKTMDLQFKRIQFTPDVTASDIVGFNYFDKGKNDFIYHEGAIMANFILADEINRTSSRTQAALLEAMEEGCVTVDGKTYLLPNPFIVIATQNPNGTSGTQPLPDAQLDRFIIKLSLGYPDFESQVMLLKDRQTLQPLDTIQHLVTITDVIQMKKAVQAIHIEESLLRYITSLTIATREHPSIQQGVSPRGALAICKMAKACAYIAGRNYVIPQDIADVFIDTCAHRLIVDSQEKAAVLLTRILETVRTPDEQFI